MNQVAARDPEQPAGPPAARRRLRFRLRASRAGGRYTHFVAMMRIVLPVVAAVLEGIPVEALLSYGSAHAIDLVVLATHGRGGFNRLVLGSVAERLLRLAPTPVLMVPAAVVAEVPGGESPATGR